MDTVSASYCQKNHFLTNFQHHQTTQRIDFSLQGSKTALPASLKNMQRLKGLLACVPTRSSTKVRTPSGQPSTLAKLRKQLRKDRIGDYVWVLGQSEYHQSYEIDLPHETLKLSGPPLDSTALRLLLGLIECQSVGESVDAQSLKDRFQTQIDSREFLGALLVLAATNFQISGSESKPLIDLKLNGKDIFSEIQSTDLGVVALIKNLHIVLRDSLLDEQVQQLRWITDPSEIDFSHFQGNHFVLSAFQNPLKTIRAQVWIHALHQELWTLGGHMTACFLAALQVLGLNFKSADLGEKRLVSLFRTSFKGQPVDIKLDEMILYLKLKNKIITLPQSQITQSYSPSPLSSDIEVKKNRRVNVLNEKIKEAMRRKLLKKEELAALIEIAIGDDEKAKQRADAALPDYLFPQ